MRFVLSALILVSSFAAQASVRAFLIPGKSAILIMEAITASTGKIDPDPRRLWDAIAMPPQSAQGGDGKIITTGDKMFNLVCGTKNSTHDSVLCNITVKPGPASQISWTDASFVVDGAEALALNQKFGPEFSYATTDGALTIVSTSEHFEFHFKQGF